MHIHRFVSVRVSDGKTYDIEMGILCDMIGVKRHENNNEESYIRRCVSIHFLCVCVIACVCAKSGVS